MLKSMTGFGRGEGETPLGRMVVECRSINHRYCDINIKLPKRFTPLESRIKEMVRSEVSRGKIELSVKLDASVDGRVQVEVDFSLADQYFRSLQLMKERYQLRGEITLELLAGAGDLIQVREVAEEVEPFWQEIAPILKQSLKDMDAMKKEEGESLAKDIRQRVDLISQLFGEIRMKFPPSQKAFHQRFRERLQTLLEGAEFDPSRFEQEVAVWVDRSDITEELVRAESHLRQFRALLENRDPVGRKMDFLLQEINREANTTGSKVNDAEISQRIVEIKGELEKIREQVQNIE